MAAKLFLLIEVSLAKQSGEHFDPQLAQTLQTTIHRERFKQDVMGVSAAVILPGQGLWAGAAGVSTTSPFEILKPDMRFTIASISKTFKAALILKLAEEGRLALQDSLHRWLAKLPYVNSNITIRQLLSHTSGVYNYTNNSAFWDSLWNDPARKWSQEEILENFVRSPVFTPGARFEYSNTNYILLEMISDTAADSTFSEQIRNRFFEPLELENSFFPAVEEVTGKIVHYWLDRDGDGKVDDLSEQIGANPYSSWGVISTATDLANWAEALHGGKVLNAASLAELREVTPVSYYPLWTGYGLGTMRFNFEGEELWGHTGSLPGLRSIIAYSPATGISVSVLVNQDDFDSVYIIAPALFKAAKTFLTTSVSQDERESLPSEFRLHQNYPNPFNQSTLIPFDVPDAANVIIELYDLRGKRVAVIANDRFEAGRHTARWNAAGFTSGLYFYRITVGAYSSVRSMVFLK